MTDEEQDAVLERMKAYPFPNLRVLCDLHRPMRYVRDGKFEECTRPECQEVMDKRRAAVRLAGAPTEEEKAVWLAQRRGDALPKYAPTGGKA